VEVSVNNYNNMKAGDDVSELKFYDINKLPSIAFDCHTKIINDFKKQYQ